MEEAHRLMDPVRFGKFWLVEKVATGGMAEIFRGVGLSADGRQQALAIKRILPQYSDDDEFISLLVDEAQLMVQLNHPNIVPIIEFGKVDESYYIAMPYIEGPTLKTLYQRLREKGDRFTVPMAVYIVREIAQGLAYAQRKRDERGKPMEIVHRDISPANILISYDGEVKVADFGISKAANQSHSTRIGVIRGKTGYMSPEQTRSGIPIDHRSDIYSLGVIFYELLSGERLFKAKSIPEALRKIREGQIRPITEVRPEVSKRLDVILKKVLAQDLEQRYQHADQLVDALNEYITRSAPGGLPQRVTHTHLTKFLKRYFPEEIGARAKEATTVMPATPMSSEPTPPETVRTEISRSASSTLDGTPTRIDPALHPKSKPETIAQNPLFELSEPGRSVEYASSTSATATGTASPSPSTQTYSLQDAVSASVRIARRFSPPVIGGIAAGILAIAVSIGFFRRSLNEVPSEGREPVPLPTSAQAANPIVPPEGVGKKTSTPTPKIQYATVKIITDPSVAMVYLDGKLETKKTPYDLERVDLGKEYKIRVTAPGYRPGEVTLKVDEPGRLVKKIFLTAVRDQPKPPPPSNVHPPVKLGSQKTQPKPGILHVNTTPWSEVFVDGKSVGTTPLPGVVVSAGRHRIQFVNPLLNLSHEVTVQFKAGREVKCIINLKQKKGNCLLGK